MYSYYIYIRYLSFENDLSPLQFETIREVWKCVLQTIINDRGAPTCWPHWGCHCPFPLPAPRIGTVRPPTHCIIILRRQDARRRIIIILIGNCNFRHWMMWLIMEYINLKVKKNVHFLWGAPKCGGLRTYVRDVRALIRYWSARCDTCPQQSNVRSES